LLGELLGFFMMGCVLVRMGQDEVLGVLESDGGWMSARDISKYYPVTITSISSCLRRLFKSGFVLRRDVLLSNGVHMYFFKVNEDWGC
jgi:predicted transcriptional regulator